MPDVRAPEVCPRCFGEGRIDVEAGPEYVVAIHCPDCTCPECHEPSPGGVLHEACDWDRDDARQVRLADR